MTSFFVDLNHLDLLAISGEDNSKFLQGQLTCDTETLENGNSCLGAACDNKGRVLSSFRLSKLSDIFYFEMQPGLLNSFKPGLDKYMVFYKAESSNAASSFKRFGLIGTEALAILAELFPSLPTQDNQLITHKGMHLLQISGHQTRYQLWVEPTGQQAVDQLLEQSLTRAPFTDWEILDLQAGIYQIEFDDVGFYTPQLLNYDISGVVNFSKGCYTGQEIVARMHYRGTAKKRLYHLTIASEQTLKSKSRIITSTNENLGTVIKCLQNTRHEYEVLAILSVNAELEINQQRCLQVENLHTDTITLRPLIYN